MKLETSKLASGMIVVKITDYISADFKQLSAILSSYNSMYPFYQSCTEDRDAMILFNMGGFVNSDNIEVFESHIWEYYDLEYIIKKSDEALKELEK